MNLVAEFTRQFQGTKDDPTLIFERLYSTTPSDLWRLTHSQIVPRNVIGYSGGWEQVLLGLDDELTGTEAYKPLIGAHEETAHKIWRELIG